ncbi:MAG: hypothetical protein ACHP9W_01175 [Steroidobacterales bacterium]
MDPVIRSFCSTQLRRRMALLMAVAVLFAGIAQAGHFHKFEARQHSDAHLQCLLCLYSASSAGAPAVVRLVVGAVAYRSYLLPASASIAYEVAVASYEARGPPLA